MQKTRHYLVLNDTLALWVAGDCHDRRDVRRLLVEAMAADPELLAEEGEHTACLLTLRPGRRPSFSGFSGAYMDTIRAQIRDGRKD